MKTGDIVQWSTRSRGVTMLKKGAIVFVVEPNQIFTEAMTNWGVPRTAYYQKVLNLKGSRTTKSYGVLVKNLSQPKKTLYWPLVASIELFRSAV